jgi:hypothetical protein
LQGVLVPTPNVCRINKKNTLIKTTATSHHQPANNTFLSEQTSTNNQPPAERTGCTFLATIKSNFSPAHIIMAFLPTISFLLGSVT